MKAVIETGGKQYLVEEGKVLYIEKLDAEAGSEITFDKVLMADGVLGKPYVKGATVTATKSGMSDLSGTANANGAYTFTIPTGGHGTWAVTANNGSVSESSNVNVAYYGSSYAVSLLAYVPTISITANGTTYTYKGAEVSLDGYFKVSPVSTTGWKMWIYANVNVSFGRLPTKVDLCAVGKGTAGGSYYYSSPNDYAGAGGTGGTITNSLAQTLSTGVSYSAVVGSGSTSFGSIVSASAGGGATGGGGAVTVDTGWSSATHNQYSYSSYGYGASGQYAFGDSTFDGTEYGHGGCGGDTNYGTGARGSTTGVYANCGAGGAGGGQSNNSPTSGNAGILLLRSST